MKFATGLAVLLALVLPGSAGAVTIESPNPIYQRWADAAKVPTPPMTVPLTETATPCGKVEIFGCASILPSIELNPVRASRFVFLHELGHVYDSSVMPEWGHGRYISLTHLSAPWEQSAADHSPQEHFADDYALCALRPRWPHNYTPWSKTGIRRHNRICRMIRATRE